MSIPLNSSTGGTTANISLTLNESINFYVNIYSLGTGANSRSLQQLAQGSASILYQVRYEIGAASNNQTCSHNITYPSEGAANNNFATNYNVNGASINISTTHLTSFSGIKWVDIPFVTSLSAGAYWMAVNRNNTTATTGGAAIMNAVSMGQGWMMVSQVNTNVIPFGGNTSVSTAGNPLGLGIWTTNSLGTSTSSIALASISTTASQPVIPFQMIRQV